jgi:hypothetical protein
MATLATVILEDVILSEVTNPANRLILTAAALGETTTGPADTRLYGRGNSRRRSAPGVLRTVPVTFELVTRAQREQLTNDAGTGWADTDTFLLLRDPRGRRLFGGFAGKAVQIAELAAVDRSTIQIDFAAVTPPVGPQAQVSVT